MKRLFVLVGVLGLIVAGAAIALASDRGPAIVTLQDAEEEATTPDVEPRRSLLSEVLDELIDEDVISEQQADTIRERVAEKRAERGLDHLHGFGHFRFPERFELPEGLELPELPEDFEFRRHFGFRFPEDFELPDDLEWRGPIEIPDEIRERLDELFDALQEEFDIPLDGRMFRFAGGTLRDFLDDGELSQEELDQIEVELRELAERFEQHFEERFEDETSIGA
jgi:hypothetical protein